MGSAEDTGAVTAGTAIVGGGIAGLACARHLHEANIPFVLIADRLGGRIALSERGHYLGAVMFNNDYVHVKKHAKKAFKSRPWQTFIWDGSKGVNFLLRMNFFKILRLNRVFGEFGEAFSRFRSQAPHTCQKTLMEQDPVLRRLVSQSAEEFVRENGIAHLTERFLGPIVGAVFLSDWRQMNAFHFCLGLACTGHGACSADWSGTIDSLTQGYRDRIVIDKVESITEADDGSAYEIGTGQRQYVAERVVVAVPGPACSALLDTANTVQEVDCHVFHIDGKRRPLYRPKRSMLMGPDEEIKLFFSLPDGVDVVYSANPSPSFARYYETHTILEHHMWKPAIQLSREEWRPLQPKPSLFTIGDYNICGLEDSYLTGLFAANKIIAQTRSSSE